MRLMIWNINRFTHNTLNRSMPYNQWYILETVYQQAVDIFVVVEVQSSQGLRGSLIQSGGKTGSLELLQILRDEDANPDWRLVPPLKLVQGIIGQTYTEGISVFYRNATLDFVGPYYWDNNQGIATAANAGTNYPASWNGALPGGNNRAGKVDFVYYNNPGAVLEFPETTHRRPFQTNFTERGGLQRNIKLFSVHLPPNQANAALALMRMSNIADIRNPGANDVVMVAGDINFNLANIGQTYLDDVRFFALVNYFVPVQFNLAAGPTRIDDVNNATLAGGPPGYGYLLPQYIDNIFVRYGTGLAAPAHNPTVINRVVGSGPYGIDMANTIPAILGMGGLNGAQKLALFQEEENYGHLARYTGVSDHLPLVIDF
jgi:hypothetical protein